MIETATLEKIEAGLYRYRGVRIYKNKHHGFSYSWRRIKPDGSSYWYPSYAVPLKQVAAKIDEDIANGGIVDGGWIVFDGRKAKA